VSLASVKEYFTPGAPSEVLELLERYGSSALIVAGGSFVHGLDARDLLYGIEALIDIRKTGLDQINADPEGLTLGSMVTFARMKRLDLVRESAALGAVRDALEYPPTQIRNVATIGGNIASACPYFDLPTALLTLDAVVRVQGAGGTREMALQDLFGGMFQNTLEENEFLTEVFLPQLPSRSASAFIKLESNANDLAIVNVAVRVSLDNSGTCTAARFAVGGGCAETAVRAPAAESVLEGATLSDDLLARAAAAVTEDLEPMSDHRASAAYRSAMARTLTHRALQRAVARLDQ